jgi:DNA-binding NtrC family response regulator
VRIERRGSRAVLVDLGSTNQTRVNGAVAREHELAPGDRIALGETVLEYQPEGGVSAVVGGNTRVTVDLEAREPFAAGAEAARLRRYLAALTRLSDAVCAADDPAAAATRACELVRGLLDAGRVAVARRDPAGWLGVVAAAAGPGAESSADLQLPRELMTRIGAGRAVASIDERRALVAAPLPEPGGLLVAERTGGPGFDADEVELVAAAARVTGAGMIAAGARATLVRGASALQDRVGAPRLLGDSPAIAEVRTFATSVAAADGTVLLLGESGVGKELVAAAIHRASPRSDGPFVAVNCAALSETLLESELFGHEKGAFTGAAERRAGRFELADGGTLFLDEVAELGLRQQAKLLRVLEERRFERVGGTQVVAVDVRVIAATNRDLAAMVRAGELRDDLYYRLSVLVGRIPPLRDRGDDVVLLAEHFLARLAPRRAALGLTPDARRALAAHTWPGNVRELRNVIERLVVLGRGDVIDGQQVEAAIGVGALARPGSGVATATPAAGSLDELERAAIAAAMAACGGNKVHAAQRLGIDRTTLYKKLRRYRIS